MGIRINGLPETTELQDGDKFVVDTPTGGTKGIKQETVKSLLGGGGGTSFKRIYQAEAVLTASNAMTLTLPLKMTGCDTDEGPEDQSETSEYLLPGDVFFVSVDTSAVSGEATISKFKLVSSKDDFTKQQDLSPYLISPSINISSSSTTKMYGSRNTPLYISKSSSVTNSIYTKSGPRLFFILLYCGQYSTKMIFSALTEGYVSSNVLDAYYNSAHNHSYVSGVIDNDTTIKKNLTPYMLSKPVKSGAFIIYVNDRLKTNGSIVVKKIYFASATNNGDWTVHSTFTSGTAKHSIQILDNAVYIIQTNTGYITCYNSYCIEGTSYI